jgi:7,8-dihydropterin-6-yl-methyl-4-(beta-D-ribofuranosyl)aminobenzene 5'-phosphate synthase
MDLRIITLSENTAGQTNVLAEWGLSLLIETDNQNILLDTGASISARWNADLLGIDLKKIDKIVLSHGHFDHTGGLQMLLSKLQREVEIVAHPDIFTPKYSYSKNKPYKYIGVPYERLLLESLGAQFNLSTRPIKLGENIMTTGEIPMVTDFEEVDRGLLVKTADGWQPDPVLDDLAVIINTPAGLIVVLGCAHRGMINTLYRAKELTGIDKIYMVVGGCHLKDSSEENIWQAISALNEMGVKKLAVSHCTGVRATLLLAQTYGNNFISNFSGNIIDVV